ncbi:calaxin-like isoform X2 [Parasteatoda tepidariorum]|uniref:calaxin-like isoform X2 n=1 Tax=Parasteatoda tepidariorum TaxID=114398 RepID=UPI0039BCE0CA
MEASKETYRKKGDLTKSEESLLVEKLSSELKFFTAADVDKDKRIDLEEFIRIVLIMLRGTVDAKIKLCFTCYDLSENNELTRDDITTLLLEALNEPPTKNNNADALRDLVEAVFSKMDLDGDGVISYEEFTAACYEDYLIMQSFGQILPDHRHRAAFLVLLDTEKAIEEM